MPSRTSMAGCPATIRARPPVISRPVWLPPAWMIRLWVWPPSSASARRPSGSRSNFRPRADQVADDVGCGRGQDLDGFGPAEALAGRESVCRCAAPGSHPSRGRRRGHPGRGSWRSRPAASGKSGRRGHRLQPRRGLTRARRHPRRLRRGHRNRWTDSGPVPVTTDRDRCPVRPRREPGLPAPRGSNRLPGPWR